MLPLPSWCLLGRIEEGWAAANQLKILADPTRFERATFAFGVRDAGFVIRHFNELAGGRAAIRCRSAISVLARLSPLRMDRSAIHDRLVVPD